MQMVIALVRCSIGIALAVYVAAHAQKKAFADEPVAAFCEPLGTFYPYAQTCPHPWIQLPMALLPTACKSNPNNFGRQQWASVCALTMKTAISNLQKQTQTEERRATAEKLAEDQAAAAAKAAKEAADKALAAISANPPPRVPQVLRDPGLPSLIDEKDVQEYQLQVKTRWAMNSIRGARTAQICGIRSEAWSEVMFDGVSASWVRARQEFRSASNNLGAYDQFAAAARDWLNHFSEPAFPSQSYCREFMASDDMELLDKIEWDLSGHYH